MSAALEIQYLYVSVVTQEDSKLSQFSLVLNARFVVE